MRSNPRNWRSIFVPIGTRRPKRRSKRRIAHNKSWGMEPLEDRRMLATGSFIRFDANGTDSDVTARFDATVQTSDIYPDFVEDNGTDNGGANQIIAHAGNTVTSNSGQEIATSTGHALSEMLTPVGTTTVAPVTSQVAAQLGTAAVNDFGSALLEGGENSSATTLYGAYQYQAPDPNPYDGFLFTGYIQMVGVGVEAAHGNHAQAGHYADMGITIVLNSVAVAQVWAHHVDQEISDEFEPDAASTGEWVIGGFTTDVDGNIYVINPDGDTSNGVNVLVTVESYISPGDTVTFDSDSPNYDSGGIDAGEWGDADYEETLASGPGTLAQYNFGEAINAWGHVDGYTNPPGPNAPPPTIGNGPVPSPGGGPGGPPPWDWDGDGDGDGDDASGVANDLANWAQGQSSVMKDWTDNIVDWTAGNKLVVTNEVDENDLGNGDTGFFDLSLREALALAADSDHPGTDDIVFAPWVHDITLDGSELEITSDVNIVGPGVDQLTIDADGLSRAFALYSSSVTATLSGMTITGGANVNYGGGIANAGNLTLNAVVISGNHTILDGLSTNTGGGIFNVGTLTVNDSTIDRNQARWGGGVYVSLSGSATFTMNNSTVSNNAGENVAASPDGLGGGVLIESASGATGQATITNSTISGNVSKWGAGLSIRQNTTVATIVNSTITDNRTDYLAGGQIISGEGGGMHVWAPTGSPTVTMHNSILAANSANSANYQDTWGSVAGTTGTPSSYNLIGQVGGSGLTNNVNGNKVGTATVFIDPLLAPLGDYGGKTKTHALEVGSPALNAGSNALAPNSDQREYERPLTTGDPADIGAFEAGLSTLTVLEPTDRFNTSFNPDDLSLREAIYFAEDLAGVETIQFDPSLYASGPATITLSYDSSSDSDSTGDELFLDDVNEVNIAGPGANLLAIDGDGETRVFRILGTSTISGLKITGGSADVGAGMLVGQGANVTLQDVSVTDNTASGAGGGIATEDSATLTILASEISDNHVTNSAGAGAGIYYIGAYEGPSSLHVTNSTISGNIAEGATSQGGGLFAYQQEGGDYPPDVVILNSTIAYNQAADGGGVYSSQMDDLSAWVEVYNTIVAKNIDLNSTASDVSGDLNILSAFNLIGTGGSGGLTDGVDGNIVGEDPLLMPLAYNGGTTRNHALIWDSPAIDAGSDDLAAGLSQDQRGFMRPVDYPSVTSDDTVDIGAVELAIYELYGL